jgi:hypothetical protein
MANSDDLDATEPEPEDPRSRAGSGWSSVSVVAVGGFVVMAVAGIFVVMSTCRSDGVKTVDVDAKLLDATLKAAEFLPDPELYQLTADLVPSSGIADLATYRGSVSYEFLSRTRRDQAEPPPVGPPGAPQPKPKYLDCAVDVTYHSAWTGADPTAGRGDVCGEPLAHPRRCTVKQVWAEAIRRGAPANGLAFVRLEMHRWRGDKGKEDSRVVPLWRFSIADQSRSIFSMELPDECPNGG